MYQINGGKAFDESAADFEYDAFVSAGSHFGFRTFAHSGSFTSLTTLNRSLHLELLLSHLYGLEYMRCPLMKLGL